MLYLCGGSYVSGAEIVALELMRGLEARGHQLHCVLSGWNDGEMIRRLEKAELSYSTVKLGMITKRITRLKYLKWTLDALFHLPAAVYQYWQVQRRVQPDIVVCASLRMAAILTVVLERERLVMHIHERPGETIFTRHFMGKLGTEPAAYVACSRYIRGELLQRGASRARVHLVPNGVEKVPKEWVAKYRPSSDATTPTVGIVGQVAQWKGHEEFLKAARQLHDDDITFRCAIIGTGNENYLKKLKEYVGRYGLDPLVEFRGFVDNTNAIYADLDICVVPSRFEEPFGLVAAEAGMRAVPVVATRRGGLPEIVVDQRTGFLVDPGDINELADRIRQLVQNPTLRKKMGRRARRRVGRKFSRRRMVRKFEQLLRRIATSKESAVLPHS